MVELKNQPAAEPQFNADDPELKQLLGYTDARSNAFGEQKQTVKVEVPKETPGTAPVSASTGETPAPTPSPAEPLKPSDKKTVVADVTQDTAVDPAKVPDKAKKYVYQNSVYGNMAKMVDTYLDLTYPDNKLKWADLEDKDRASYAHNALKYLSSFENKKKVEDRIASAAQRYGVPKFGSVSELKQQLEAQDASQFASEYVDPVTLKAKEDASKDKPEDRGILTAIKDTGVSLASGVGKGLGKLSSAAGTIVDISADISTDAAGKLLSAPLKVAEGVSNLLGFKRAATTIGRNAEALDKFVNSADNYVDKATDYTLEPLGDTMVSGGEEMFRQWGSEKAVQLRQKTQQEQSQALEGKTIKDFFTSDLAYRYLKSGGWAGFTDTVVNMAGEMVGPAIATAGVGAGAGVASRLGGIVGRSAAAVETAVTSNATKITTALTAGTVGEDAKTSVEQFIDSIPGDTLVTTPAYLLIRDSLRREGKTPTDIEIRDKMKDKFGNLAFGAGSAVSALTMGASKGDFVGKNIIGLLMKGEAKDLGQRAAAQTAGKTLLRVGEGVVTEGAQEFAESGAQEAASIAANKMVFVPGTALEDDTSADEFVPEFFKNITDKRVGVAASTGGLLGGILGGAVGAAGSQSNIGGRPKARAANKADTAQSVDTSTEASSATPETGDTSAVTQEETITPLQEFQGKVIEAPVDVVHDVLELSPDKIDQYTATYNQGQGQATDITPEEKASQVIADQVARASSKVNMSLVNDSLTEEDKIPESARTNWGTGELHSPWLVGKLPDMNASTHRTVFSTDNLGEGQDFAIVMEKTVVGGNIGQRPVVITRGQEDSPIRLTGKTKSNADFRKYWRIVDQIKDITKAADEYKVVSEATKDESSVAVDAQMEEVNAQTTAAAQINDQQAILSIARKKAGVLKRKKEQLDTRQAVMDFDEINFDQQDAQASEAQPVVQDVPVDIEQAPAPAAAQTETQATKPKGFAKARANAQSRAAAQVDQVSEPVKNRPLPKKAKATLGNVEPDIRPTPAVSRANPPLTKAKLKEISPSKRAPAPKSKPRAFAKGGANVPGSISSTDLNNTIEKFLSRWRATAAQDGLNVKVYESTREVPGELSKTKLTDDIAGFYTRFEGKPTVVLVRNNIENVDEAEAVIAHEIIGHYGASRLLGSVRYNEMLTRIKREVLDNPESDIAKLYNQLKKIDWYFGDEKALLEEILARGIDQTDVQLPRTFLDKFKAGFEEAGLPLTRVDAVDFARLAREADKNLIIGGRFIPIQDLTDEKIDLVRQSFDNQEDNTKRGFILWAFGPKAIFKKVKLYLESKSINSPLASMFANRKNRIDNALSQEFSARVNPLVTEIGEAYKEYSRVNDDPISIKVFLQSYNNYAAALHAEEANRWLMYRFNPLYTSEEKQQAADISNSVRDGELSPEEGAYLFKKLAAAADTRIQTQGSSDDIIAYDRLKDRISGVSTSLSKQDLASVKAKGLTLYFAKIDALRSDLDRRTLELSIEGHIYDDAAAREIAMYGFKNYASYKHAGAEGGSWSTPLDMSGDGLVNTAAVQSAAVKIRSGSGQLFMPDVLTSSITNLSTVVRKNYDNSIANEMAKLAQLDNQALFRLSNSPNAGRYSPEMNFIKPESPDVLRPGELAYRTKSGTGIIKIIDNQTAKAITDVYRIKPESGLLVRALSGITKLSSKFIVVQPRQVFKNISRDMLDTTSKIFLSATNPNLRKSSQIDPRRIIAGARQGLKFTKWVARNALSSQAPQAMRVFATKDAAKRDALLTELSSKPGQTGKYFTYFKEALDGGYFTQPGDEFSLASFESFVDRIQDKTITTRVKSAITGKAGLAESVKTGIEAAGLAGRKAKEVAATSLDVFLSTVESTHRMAAYGALRESGWSKEDAGNYMRSLIDFQIDSKAIEGMSKYWLFVRSSIAGIYRLSFEDLWINGEIPYSFRDTDSGVKAYLSVQDMLTKFNYPQAIAKVGIGYTIANAAIMALAGLTGDEDDAEAKKKIKEATKSIRIRDWFEGFVIPQEDGSPLSLPVQYGFDSITHSIGTWLALDGAGAYSRDSLTKELIERTAMSTLPIGGLNLEQRDSAGENEQIMASVLVAMAPFLGQFILQEISNRDAFGNTIRPDQFEQGGLNPTYDVDNYKPGTPEVFINIANHFKDSIGADISPNSFQHLVTHFTGFYGSVLVAGMKNSQNQDLSLGQGIISAATQKVNPFVIQELDDIGVAYTVYNEAKANIRDIVRQGARLKALDSREGSKLYDAWIKDNPERRKAEELDKKSTSAYVKFTRSVTKLKAAMAKEKLDTGTVSATTKGKFEAARQAQLNAMHRAAIEMNQLIDGVPQEDDNNEED